MTSLIEIQAQIEQLQSQAKILARKEYSQVVSQVQALITSHKIKASDLNFSDIADEEPTQKKAGKKAPVKYRDENGNTWSGRGLKPVWLSNAIKEGKDLASFAV